MGIPISSAVSADGFLEAPQILGRHDLDIRTNSRAVNWFCPLFLHCSQTSLGNVRLDSPAEQSRGGAFFIGTEARMGLAEYTIVAKGNRWTVLHDGAANNEKAGKEAEFVSAVAAAWLALRERHEVREAGKCTALGVKE